MHVSLCVLREREAELHGSEGWHVSSIMADQGRCLKESKLVNVLKGHSVASTLPTLSTLSFLVAHFA